MAPAADWGYRMVVAATSPLWLPLLAAHPRLRGGLGERFGWLPTPLPERPVWLHGASAGDVAALHPLLADLESRGFPVVLSTWTRAGEQMGRALCGDRVALLRAPLDLRGPVRRVLARLRPRLLVLEGLEMWPHLVSACAAGGVPVAMVNGRLSSRSLLRYARAPSIFEPCFSSLAYVSALTDDDAARFERAGTAAERIEVRTSTKHAGLRLDRVQPRIGPPRVVLGSIHHGEERPLLDWLARLWGAGPVTAVVAPRYPGRARALRRALKRRGLPASLSSESGAVTTGRIEILDGIGQLRERYQGATLAFVGGSLVPRGGHNLVEPAACGVPVLFGPSTENCSTEAAALRAVGAGWEVGSEEELWQRSLALLRDPSTWQRASSAAWQVAHELAAAARPVAERLAQIAMQTPPLDGLALQNGSGDRAPASALSRLTDR